MGGACEGPSRRSLAPNGIRSEVSRHIRTGLGSPQLKVLHRDSDTRAWPSVKRSGLPNTVTVTEKRTIRGLGRDHVHNSLGRGLSRQLHLPWTSWRGVSLCQCHSPRRCGTRPPACLRRPRLSRGAGRPGCRGRPPERTDVGEARWLPPDLAARGRFAPGATAAHALEAVGRARGDTGGLASWPPSGRMLGRLAVKADSRASGSVPNRRAKMPAPLPSPVLNGLRGRLFERLASPAFYVLAVRSSRMKDSRMKDFS
jgi:hypothetical protein